MIVLNLWWLLLSTWEDPEHLGKKLLGVSVRDFLVSFTLSGKTLQPFIWRHHEVGLHPRLHKQEKANRWPAKLSLSSYSYNVTSLLRWTVASSWWPGYNVTLALTNVSLTESPDSDGYNVTPLRWWKDLQRRAQTLKVLVPWILLQ